MPDFNPMTLLHGEESVIVERPFKPNAKYIIQEEVKDFQDKGKGSLLIFDAQIREAETGELQSTVRTGFFIVGLGGHGHKGVVDASYPNAPKRQPDFTSEDKVPVNQAFIYRLCNDINPLHVDPQMSKMGGFKIPILHGLCTLGYSFRAI